MTNPVLEAIRNRRSVLRFEDKPVEEEKIEAVLEAGRWAPSWLNKQPWNFIVVKDRRIKEELAGVVPTVFVQGLKEAPMCIAIVVDTEADEYHFVEDGAVVAQNMTLAAQSLGLSSCWIGIFDVKSQKKSNEAAAKKILEIPEKHRIISILPIGYSNYAAPKKERKTLYELVYKEKFGKR